MRSIMVVRLFDPWMGGMERQSLILAQALQGTGVEVRILTGRWFRRTPRRQEYEGVQVLRHGAIYDGWGIRGARRLAAVVYMITLAWTLWRCRRSFDVIHVHGLSYHAYVAVRVGRMIGKPVVVKLANSGPASDIRKMRTGQHVFFSRVLLPTALMADRFVALNNTIAEELIDAGVDRDRITEIPNGFEKPGWRAQARMEHSRMVVSFIGRLHEQKAVDVLIRAAAQSGLFPGQARLLIAGDGPARAPLEALAAELLVEGSVEFLGFVSDPDEVLRQTDLLVLPSLAEGMSNTLLEAMSRGIPVIASDIPPNAVLVDHDRTGWLFPPGDAGRLAGLLSSHLLNPDILAEVGERALLDVTNQYAIELVAERYVELYEGLPRSG